MLEVLLGEEVVDDELVVGTGEDGVVVGDVVDVVPVGDGVLDVVGADGDVVVGTGVVGTVVGAGEVGVGDAGDGVGDVVEPSAGEVGSPAPSSGDVVGEGWVAMTGAPPRIVMISDLNVSSWSVISAREYAEMPRPNSISLFHTPARARSCSSSGSPGTVRTSWLATAAVMHW